MEDRSDRGPVGSRRIAVRASPYAGVPSAASPPVSLRLLLRRATILSVSRHGAAVSSCLQHDRQALTDADAERGDAPAATAATQLVGAGREHAGAARAERVAERDRAAVDVHALEVEL